MLWMLDPNKEAQEIKQQIKKLQEKLRELERCFRRSYRNDLPPKRKRNTINNI